MCVKRLYQQLLGNLLIHHSLKVTIVPLMIALGLIRYDCTTSSTVTHKDFGSVQELSVSKPLQL
jgi:hypothetical protein